LAGGVSHGRQVIEKIVYRYFPIGVPDASHSFTISGVRSTSSAGISGHIGAQIHVAVPPGQIALTLIPRSASYQSHGFRQPDNTEFRCGISVRGKASYQAIHASNVYNRSTALHAWDGVLDSQERAAQQ
jgi:hypothetical protein